MSRRSSDTMHGAALVLTVLTLGCGHEAPPTCSKDVCSGAYVLTIDQTSGTCPGVAAGPATLDHCVEPSPYCPIASETWSDNDCTVTQARTCFNVGTGTRTDQVWTVTQSETGDTLTGTLTATQSRSDGTLLCTGSYTVTGTRQ